MMFVILERGNYYKKKEQNHIFAEKKIDFCTRVTIIYNDIAVKCSCFFDRDSFSGFLDF